MTGTADRIPMILERVDLMELVTTYSGPPATVLSGTPTFHCPNPDHPDKHPSFTVKDGRWTCWSQCAASGNAIDLLLFVGAADSVADAIVQLAHRVGLTEPRQTPGGRKGKPRLDPAVVQEVLDAHLRSRRWPPELAAELDLSVMVDRGGHRRIRHPFRLRGVEVGWQARAVDDDVDPRWLSSGGSIQCPYEADRLALAEENGGIVAITEGISDAASIIAAVPTLAVVGIPGTNGFKAKWVDAFADLYVLVFGDNDAAGEKFRSKVAQFLAPTATVCQVPVPMDYGDVTDWLIGASDRDTFAHDLLDACQEALESHRD